MRKITGNGNGEEIYGIVGGTRFDLEHIMALKLYTDFAQLCGLFCDQFRLKTIIDDILESIESLRARNEFFYHLAKLLTECVQCFGAVIHYVANSKKQRQFFRGIKGEYMFRRFVTRYHCPMSTTWDVCCYFVVG